MNQATIQISTGSDIGDTLLENNLKQYAYEKYGWTEQIDDPENLGQLIDNPVTYIQAVFVDGAMANFWKWLTDIKNMEKRAEATQEVDDMKAGVSLSVMQEE